MGRRRRGGRGHRVRRGAVSADGEEGGKTVGTVLTELGYIKSGVDDIKRKQERQDEQNMQVTSRLTAVESSVKQAHKRLDMLEEREERR